MSKVEKEGESDEPDFSFPFESEKKEESSVTCPKCGRKFKNSRGLNIHIGQVHD